HFIYKYVCVDLSGYDFCFLELLFNSDINILLVGDPRQSTYLTSNSPKNKQYAGFGITNFFQKIECLVIDEESLIVNHRSIPDICDFSNKLFPDYIQTQSGNTTTSGHDGVFLVRKKDVGQYLEQYNPTQLRYNKKTNTNDAFEAMNFGNSKGLSFDRVLIYPTGGIEKWLKNNKPLDSPTTLSKLYVAITRAQYSVAFVYDYKDGEIIEDCTPYTPNT
nr:ATP-dependent helicase [Pseudomonadota bacterium]